MSLIEVSDISNMLAGRIDSLCAELLPRGRREGSEWVDANVARGGLGDSMRVCVTGARVGVWAHFANTGARGDALDLVAYVLFQNDKKKAIAWAKSWLGLDENDPKRLKQQRVKAAADAKKRQAEADKEILNKRKFAQSLWHNANPNIIGTNAELYLLGRGLGPGDLLTVTGKLPGAIRYVDQLKHPNGNFYPALVAQINDDQGAFVGIHRTFLKRHPDHVVSKISPEEGEAKLTLGRWAGGFIALNRGSSNKSLKDAPEGDVVVLTEGIEDGLSVAMACPDMRVLACINVGNFKNMTLPPAVSTVIIAADNDEVGSQADKSMKAAVDRFLNEGRNVSVARSPMGKDFNDCLQSDAANPVKNEGAA